MMPTFLARCNLCFQIPNNRTFHAGIALVLRHVRTTIITARLPFCAHPILTMQTITRGSSRLARPHTRPQTRRKRV